MSTPTTPQPPPPPDQEELSLEFSGELGACVTPPTDPGRV